MFTLNITENKKKVTNLVGSKISGAHALGFVRKKTVRAQGTQLEVDGVEGRRRRHTGTGPYRLQ